MMRRLSVKRQSISSGTFSSLSHVTPIPPEIITRTAIDSSGSLGSLYDGWRDQFVGTLNINIKEPSVQSLKSVRCAIQKKNEEEILNLLRIVGIEDELSLSILVNLVPKTGIASIIDYPRLIDKYTRFFHYHYVDREEHLPEDQIKDKTYIKSSTFDSFVTHIIDKVSWGIDLVVVLQLPSDDELVNAIDSLLERVRLFFEENSNSLTITSDENQLFEEILSTTVYSNVSDLTKMTNILEIFRHLNRMKENSIEHRPFKYSLHPIRSFFSQDVEESVTFVPLESEYRDFIERDLLRSFVLVKESKWLFEHDMRDLLEKYLDEQRRQAHRLCSDLKNIHTIVIQQLQELIVAIRMRRERIAEIDALFRNVEYTTWQQKTNDLNTYVNDLTRKGHWIRDLEQEKFEYCNAIERGIQNGDDETMIEQKLVRDGEYERVLCFNDTLKKRDPLQWNELRTQLLREREENAELRLIYADFSYCSFELNDMVILPSILKSDIINVLLLGESGVGKSTFINALVNYFKFKTLKQAQSSKPIVLIPVSFLMTINDAFDEKLVKFGDVDTSNDEDHNHPGQSVTQHCNSYVFDLSDSGGTRSKLRIIDTPGFGDTRGLERDDANLEHILAYVNNLTHLNAVCFLLKPNTSQLNIIFRSCLTQLLEFLGENAHENIVFLFTNARSTFFAPGNTAPLLKTMLESLPISKISFNKANTFCFDNEAFRYLVAVQNSIEFNDAEKDEYELSWSQSVIESNRLLHYIRSNLTPYRMHVDWKSTKHAQLQINQLIRPMLETLRNIFRNGALWNMKSPNESIELCPKKLVCTPSALCLSCKRNPNQFGDCWIMPDCLHKYRNICHTCSCSSNKHIPADYELEYKLLHRPSSLTRDEMSDMLGKLAHDSVEFAHFLIHVAHSTQSDPFLSILNRMIAEEAAIRTRQDPNYLNQAVYDDLEKFKENHERRMKSMTPKQEQNKLSIIYESITSVRMYPMIREQMAAVKEGQEIMMKQHEHEVSQSSISH